MAISLGAIYAAIPESGAGLALSSGQLNTVPASFGFWGRRLKNAYSSGFAFIFKKFS